MGNLRHQKYLLPFCALALAVVLGAGCGKKETNTSPAPSTQPTAAATPRATTASAAAPMTGGETGVDARLKEAEAALQAHNYDKATDTLVALQQQPRQLTDQQAGILSGLMRRLQNELAGAVALGDPAAKAAADKLRRASTPR